MEKKSLKIGNYSIQTFEIISFLRILEFQVLEMWIQVLKIWKKREDSSFTVRKGNSLFSHQQPNRDDPAGPELLLFPGFI